MSQYVTVNGHVKGDILGFGQEIRVNGPVDGNVRAWCQTITLNSAVAKNVMVWSQVVELDTKATVGGTATIGTQVAQLNGQIGGDVLGGGRSRGHRWHDGPRCHDPGRPAEYRTHRRNQRANEVCRRESTVEISSGAKLASPPIVSTVKRGPGLQPGSLLLAPGDRSGARAFLLGLVILLVAPGFFFDVEQACKKVGPRCRLRRAVPIRHTDCGDHRLRHNCGLERRHTPCFCSMRSVSTPRTFSSRVAGRETDRAQE